MTSFDHYEGPYQAYQGGALFARHCPKCCRYVKADHEVIVNGFEEIKRQPNATCAKCGRVEMPFIGYFSEEDLT